MHSFHFNYKLTQTSTNRCGFGKVSGWSISVHLTVVITDKLMMAVVMMMTMLMTMMTTTTTTSTTTMTMMMMTPTTMMMMMMMTTTMTMMLMLMLMAMLMMMTMTMLMVVMMMAVMTRTMMVMITQALMALNPAIQSREVWVSTSECIIHILHFFWLLAKKMKSILASVPQFHSLISIGTRGRGRSWTGALRVLS